MNFAGPFDSELTHVSPVSLGGDGFAFNKPTFIQHQPSDSHIVIPDAHLLFSGDYTRIGNDLIISGEGQKLVVGNYFKGEARPALTSKDGATLAGHIVDALTGHVHYAQANTAAPAAGQVIGHVLKLSGSATAIRNGVSVELHIGDAVQKGDVIQTGSDSSVGMTFVDGSAFGMTSNARMVLNEMIYDPNGSSNSSLMSLVQGTITFVAGQTAKNGNMRVETPVATMGIRGTAVLVEIGANDGPTKFSVLVEPDGHTGSYNLYDKSTGDLIGTVSQAGQVTYVTSLGLGQPPSAIEQLKTLQDQQNEKSIIQQVFQLYFPNYKPDDSNPKSPKFGANTSGNNLAEIIFTTNSNKQQTFLTQIELRFAVTDPNTGITTYQNKLFYNTKAQFSALSVFGDQAFTPTTETFKFADVVKIDDPDIGNAPFYDIGVPFVAGSAIINSAISTIPQMSEAFLKSLLSINQTTGVVSFDRQQFNFLDDGQTVTFKIQVTATSGPDTGLVEIPVTITGENDAPTIVVGTATTIAGGVKEDTAITTSGDIATHGTITFQDFDLTDAHTATVALTSTASGLPHFVAGTEIGHFTIDPVSESLTDTNNQGSVGWHFTLDDHDPTLQSLAEGQTITQTYTITIKDNNGVPVTQTVTITITGTNDAPVLTADTSIHHADEVVNTTNSSVEDVVNGSLAFTDVDLSDTHSATAALHPGAGSVVWSGGSYSGIPSATLAALGTAMKTTVTDSTGTGAGSVGWEFKLPDHLFDFLADGETLTLIYDVTITDNNGVSSTKQVTVQIGAANDQPTISVIDAGATVQEDVSVQPGNLLTDTGSVTFTDTDLSDTHTAHVAFNGAVGANGGSVSTGLLAALGTALSVPGSALAAGVHTFDWDFALNNNLVQYLGAGETVTATYTITVKDNSGDTNATSAGQTVTVVITGTNDTPVITAVDVTGAVKEDTALAPGNVLHDTGSVTFADADLTDHETATVAFVGATDSGSYTIPAGLSTALQHALTLQTGAFSSNTGTITWNFNLDNSLVQYLADGETITVSYTITVKDDSATATDTSAAQTVTVVITGTNDAPTVSGAVTDVNVVEDSATSVLNALANASDVDNGAVLSVVNVPGTLPAGVIYNAANHTFTLDPSNAAYQHLGVGQSTVVTVNYGVTDGIVSTPTAASVSWTITGTNDAPTVSGAVTATVAEDAASSTLNALANASDVDDLTTLSVVNVPGTLPAGVTYNAADHTFTLDPSNAAYQHLGVGQSTVVTVNYAVTDGTVTTPTPASVSWTVTGTNDDPTVAGPLTIATTEGNAPVVRDLLAGASDPDSGDSPSIDVSSIRYSVNGGSPTTTIPDGITFPDAHTINIDAAGLHHLPANATDTIVVSYNIVDGHGGVVAQTETITVTGMNDRPVLAAGTNLAAITEDQISNPGQLVSSFATGISDPDDNALKGVAITGSTSQNGHWEYSIDGGGSWTTFGAYSSTGGLLLASDDKVRFVPNGENGGTDTLTYVAWDQTSGSHGQVTNTVSPMFWAAFSEGSQAQTASLTVTDVNDAPHIDASNAHLSISGGSTVITGAAVIDPDTADSFTVVLSPDSGTATGTINSITYTPPGVPPQTGQVSATVTDIAGASDTVNFIFNVSGTGPVTMQSTSQKDVFFATAYQDTFVFTSGSNHDTISGFAAGTDKIDLQAFSSIDAAALTSLLANADHIGSDTLLHLNGNTDTVLVKGVATLNASDFILHA